MRIISLRVSPVARAFAIVYGVLGFIYVPLLLLVGAKEMVLPVGLVGPPIFFNLNLHFALPTNFTSGVLSALFATLCYAASGCGDRRSGSACIQLRSAASRWHRRVRSGERLCFC